MAKRLFWMTTGYAAGAASSWAVQRKVKREVEKVLPEAVRNEVTNRVTAAGDRALERTINSPVAQTCNRAVQKVRPDIDLTDKAQARWQARQAVDLRLVEVEDDPAGFARLRERARRLKS